MLALALFAAAPAWAQSGGADKPSEAPKPDSTPAGEMPAAGTGKPAADPVPEPAGADKDKKQEKIRLKPTYKARASAKIPDLPREEDAFKAAEKAADELSKKAKLGETGTAQVRTVALEFARRKFALLSKAHADLPLRNQECARRIVEIAPKFAGKEIPADWVNLMLEAARLRPEQLLPRRREDERQNAFTALVERSDAGEDGVRKAVMGMRTSLAKGDPWTVASRISSVDTGLNEALKLVLTPEEYFRVLEVRGVIKPANYASVGTPHFTKALEALKLDEATLARVNAILDDKELIPELKYEKIARMLGDDREKELAAALKEAQKALDKARKDAAKAKEQSNRRDKPGGKGDSKDGGK
jgi:hypothetical protein